MTKCVQCDREMYDEHGKIIDGDLRISFQYMRCFAE